MRNWTGPCDRFETATAIHLVLTGSQQKHRLTLPVGVDTHAPLAIALDLDEFLEQRTSAALAFWQEATEQPQRLPTAAAASRGRSRIVEALRAFDARQQGASNRAIATNLFGEQRVTEEVWKTSSLRAQTIRLVANGARLVCGGYADFLHAAARKPRKQ